MVSCSDDILLNGMNGDRTKEEELDPITMEGKQCLRRYSV